MKICKASVSILAFLSATCDAKPNIIMFAIDDLRAEFGQAYDAPWVQTPNIDKLARRSGATVMQQAYVQFAHCVVSRASILSGRYPAFTRAKTGNPFGFGSCARGPGNFTTLPTLLREHGYRTAGGGKVFHPDTCDGAALGEDKYAWSEQPYFHAPCFQWGSLPCRNQSSKGAGCGVPSYMSNATALDNEVPDGMIAANAVKQLRSLVAGTQTMAPAESPWFLAVGFHKPHLPHFAPKKYFDMYANMSYLIPPPVPRGPPASASPVVWANEAGTHELWEYDDIIQKYGANYWENATNMATLPAAEVLQQRIAYAAVVSFTDAQIGTVLTALDATGAADNTVIALWGDHGWHLGEQARWAKCTNFEHALKIPLIFVLPKSALAAAAREKVTQGRARRHEYASRNKEQHMRKHPAIVQAVDVYPTIIELALGGDAVPARCPLNATLVKKCVDGTSLVPLLDGSTIGEASEGTDSVEGDADDDNHAFNTVRGLENAFAQWHGGAAVGYTVRNSNFRYTEWVSPNTNISSGTPHWDRQLAHELYDHRSDPREAQNVAGDEKYAKHIRYLSRILHEQREPVSRTSR